MKGCCGKVMAGVTGLSKVAFGVDSAPADVVARRRAACWECARLVRRRVGPVTFVLCGVCDCFMGAKTRLAGEECPVGKW